jgi:hypothetical protein
MIFKEEMNDPAFFWRFDRINPGKFLLQQQSKVLGEKSGFS